MTNEPNSDIIECYGKTIDCAKRKDCKFADPCLSASRETSENNHYRYQNISIGNMIYDPNADKDDQDISGIFDFINANSTESENEQEFKIGNTIITGESYAVVMSVLEEMASFYFYMPNVFEALMNAIFKGKSQSDLAREKFITRQCQNKRLLREMSIAQKRNDIQERRDRELEQAKLRLQHAEEQAKSQVKSFIKMTATEFSVYKLCAEDGCLSATSVSNQLGINRREVYRAIHNLREKYDIFVSLIPYSKNKITKK